MRRALPLTPRNGRLNIREHQERRFKREDRSGLNPSRNPAILKKKPCDAPSSNGASRTPRAGGRRDLHDRRRRERRGRGLFRSQRAQRAARAANFDVNDLRRIMTSLHRKGVKGYVTLNTLIFPSELEQVETIVRKIVEAGVNAVIVQDFGLARLIRGISPDIEIHASTQMSITSAEGVRLAKELGCSRVILRANCRCARSPGSRSKAICRWRFSSTARSAWPIPASA